MKRTKTYRAGGAFAIAIALAAAGCGSARHLSQTTTEVSAAAHVHRLKPTAEHHRSHRQAARRHGIAKPVSRQAAENNPEHRAAGRHITRSTQPKTTTRELRTSAEQQPAVVHQHAAATKRRSATKSAQSGQTKKRSGRTTMKPDGSGTAPATPLNADGAASGGGQSGTAANSGAPGASADG
jgi:hypothetical protein